LGVSANAKAGASNAVSVAMADVIVSSMRFRVLYADIG
jgi:hypothetical protein